MESLPNYADFTKPRAAEDGKPRHVLNLGLEDLNSLEHLVDFVRSHSASRKAFRKALLDFNHLRSLQGIEQLESLECISAKVTRRSASLVFHLQAGHPHPHP